MSFPQVNLFTHKRKSEVIYDRGILQDTFFNRMPTKEMSKK